MNNFRYKQKYFGDLSLTSVWADDVGDDVLEKIFGGNV